jgi:hypothetical protein
MATRLKASKRLTNRLLAETFLQPWFVPLEIAKSIRRLLPAVHFHKMRFYFDDWECMRCEKKGIMYGANGMCSRCAQKVQHRVVFCFQKRHRNIPLPLTRILELCSRVDSAKALLSDLVQHTLPRKSRTKVRTRKPAARKAAGEKWSS